MIQKAVGDVGRLIRTQRQQARTLAVATQDHINKLQNSIYEAFNLEARLLHMPCPSEDQIINPADENTSVQHLIKFAQVYRLVGLLQLYRIFPDLLRQRLQTSMLDLDPEIRPYFGLQTMPYLSHASSTNSRDLSDWITTFALKILELLKQVPLHSGTCAFQPFLLIACGGELRLPQASKVEPGGNEPGGDFASNTTIGTPELCVNAVKVLRAREVILGRLETLARILPPKPHKQCILIVQETWNRMDSARGSPIHAINENNADGTVFWMDIMMENGWETVLG
jgi:hypothetical protein